MNRKKLLLIPAALALVAVLAFWLWPEEPEEPAWDPRFMWLSDGYDIGDKKTVVTELEDYMGRHYQHDSHIKDEHVPAFLQKMKEHGVRMCVATGSRREYGCIGLENAGILDFFEFVTDNYEAGNGVTKADPEYFIQAAKRLGAAPENCVVVEDAYYAMEAAKKAGCRVLAIEDQTARLQKDKIVEVADWYIRSYEELL